MAFQCNVCGCSRISKETVRGDGVAVSFCADCGMGVVSNPPESTDAFYGDGYYGNAAVGGPGYHDYAFTAEHTLLWPRLMVEALAPAGGRVLDVGCADGFLLKRLPGPYERFGIEVNIASAKQAAAHGITIIGSEISDPKVVAGLWGRFDLITSIATFEHVLDLRGAIEICLAQLAPAGALLFEVPLISDHRDNTDWFQSSYEHIYYPTLSGLERLLKAFACTYFAGFETDIKGFGSTYIGAITRDETVFARVRRLFRAMTQPDGDGLNIIETQLNLAYHVVHCFRPTPERVLALPALLDVAATPYLLKRLTQLWHADSLRAAEADVYAHNWESASNTLDIQRETIAALGGKLTKFEDTLAPILSIRRGIRRLLGYEGRTMPR